MGTSRLERLLDSYRLATKRRPPRGQILVHNRSTPRTDPGTPGFRAWWTKPATGFVSCDCGWRPDLGRHYRVERPGPLAERRGRPGVHWTGRYPSDRAARRTRSRSADHVE
jgi:hypothetical protein